MKQKHEKEEEKQEESAVAQESSSAETPACDQCEQFILGWRRALADYDNLKKDLSAERVRMREYVHNDAVERIIPVLDNFDSALAFKPEGLDPKVENWLQGLLYVRTQLEGVVGEFQAVPFGQIGDVFDPTLHDAGAEKEVEGQEAGVIVEVVRRGWKHGDHVIRPAKVIVSK